MAETRSTKTSDLLPEPTLRRLPWYLAYVAMLKSEGVEYVSTTRISENLAVDSSQIAKDLSFLNIKGKTRIGYEVVSLEKELRHFLGFSNQHNAIMAGVGSLGAALLRDLGLHRYGLNIVAGIDIDPDIIGSEIGNIQVSGPADLRKLVDSLNISIGILAVPVEVAQTVANQLVEAGIKAIWNFTPTRIRVPQDVVITNTSIYSHLAVMYNRLDTRKQQ